MQSLTANEAAMVGAFLGLGAGAILMLSVVWFFLVAIGEWKVFTKGGRPGWHSLIPVLREYDLYDMCWEGTLGLVAGIIALVGAGTSGKSPEGVLGLLLAVAGIVALVLRVLMSLRLARSFGKGTGFAVGLILLEPVFLMILGFGDARYLGKQG